MESCTSSSNFGDDIALVTRSKEELEETFKILETRTDPFVQYVNEDKTKYLELRAKEPNKK